MAKRNRTSRKSKPGISEYDLRRLDESDLSFGTKDLLDPDLKLRGTHYFLNHFSIPGIELILKKYGIYQKLEKLGFDGFQLRFDADDPFRHRLSLYFDHCADPQHLLGELILKLKSIALLPTFSSPGKHHSFEVLFIEWLTLRNPRGNFTPERPRLPGQEYPGLGLGWAVLDLLVLTCKRLRLGGLLLIPEYFHNAWMYAKAAYFVDPEQEGKRRAIQRDLLTQLSLFTVSWAIELRCVRENDRPFSWFTSDQLIPLKPRLKEFFNDPHYRSLVRKAEENHIYTLDKKCWKEKQPPID